MVKEIRAAEMDCEKFIAEQVREIRAAVGDGTAINAFSGCIGFSDHHDGLKMPGGRK